MARDTQLLDTAKIELDLKHPFKDQSKRRQLTWCSLCCTDNSDVVSERRSKGRNANTSKH
eukprot:606921-Amphidinium_carterae.1